MVGYYYTGPSPWDIPASFDAYPPEWVKPDVKRSPETGKQVKNNQSFVKPAGKHPDHHIDDEHNHRGNQEESPEYNAVNKQTPSFHGSGVRVNQKIAFTK
jgi:hypothetical protein